MIYNVTLTWSGVEAPSPEVAAIRFQQLLGIELPGGTALTVMDDETGTETEEYV